MTCEICGWGSCRKSFHSLSEQGEFDKENDPIEQKDAEIKEWKLAWQESTDREMLLHAREAMLVEALEQADVHTGMLKIRNALHNSTEHVDKWLAEVKAKTMEDASRYVKDNWSTADHNAYGAVREITEELRIMAQEIRSGK